MTTNFVLRISKRKILMYVGTILLLLYPYSISVADKLYYTTFIKLLVTLIGYLLVFFLFYRNKILISKYDIAWLVVIFFVLFRNQNVGTTYLASDLLFIAMIILSIWIKADEKWIDVFLNCIYGFSFFYALMTIICWLFPSIYLNYIINLMPQNMYGTLKNFYNSGYIAGFTSHYSINGIYLSVGIGVCVAKIIRDYDHKQVRMLRFGEFFVMFFSLILCAKRAHLLFSVFAIFAVYYIYNSNKKGLRDLKIICLAFACILVFCLVASISPTVKNIAERYVSALSGEDQGVNDRIVLYTLALNLFKSSLFLGIGWCGFRHKYNLLHSAETFSMLDVHNVYIQLITETGIIGAVIIIPLLFYSTIRIIKAFREASFRNIKRYQYYLSFAMFIQVFFIMYCFTGNPLYDCQFFVPYFVSIGILNSYITSRGKKNESCDFDIA